jgi:hypothetical protein
LCEKQEEAKRLSCKKQPEKEGVLYSFSFSRGFETSVVMEYERTPLKSSLVLEE